MLGEILRQKRKESGLKLEEVALTLKMRPEYLIYIEDNAFEKLPADVYTIGYIREYAKLLNINSDPIIKAYKEQKLQKAGPYEIQTEQHPKIKRFISQRVKLLAFILISALTTIVMSTYPWKSEKPQKENKTDILNDQSHDSAHADDPQHQLRVTAIETTWLRIETDDGKHEEVLMRAGDTKEWASQNGFNLKVGNAGGIKLMLNGKDIGFPGQRGKVLKLRLPLEELPAQPLQADNSRR